MPGRAPHTAPIILIHTELEQATYYEPPPFDDDLDFAMTSLKHCPSVRPMCRGFSRTIGVWIMDAPNSLNLLWLLNISTAVAFLISDGKPASRIFNQVSYFKQQIQVISLNGCVRTTSHGALLPSGRASRDARLPPLHHEARILPHPLV